MIMPTEVTTDVRKNISPVAEKSRVQHDEVIAANRIDARQNLSQQGQVVPSTKESSQPSSQQLEQTAEKLNKQVQSLKRDLHFSIDDETGETVIRVVDSASKELIRTIPSEEFVSIQQKFNQSIGVLLNASV